VFNLFGRKTAKDFMDEAQETYSIPKVKPVSVPKPKNKEFYRVGFDDEGNTTLTFIGDNGYGSMTLTMTQEACEKLIRMLESTFTVNKATEEE
jgi:hypothetical protein